MTLTLGPILRSAGLDPAGTLVTRHAYVREHEDSGLAGIHADSSDDDILRYTSIQSSNPRIFPASPPTTWVVFVREGGDRARLWLVLENRGEIADGGTLRTFDLTESELWRTCAAGSSSAGALRARGASAGPQLPSTP